MLTRNRALGAGGAVLLILLLLLGLFLIFRPAAGAAGTSPATLTLFFGTTTLQKGGAGAAQPAATGATAVSGDVIATQSASRSMLTYGDGSLVRLDANTAVTVKQVGKSGGHFTTEFAQTSGRTWNRVARLLSGSSYKVDGPNNSTAEARGTDFTVSIGKDANGQTIVIYECFAGSIHVSEGGKSVDLNAGQAVTAGPNGNLGPVGPIPAADLSDDFAVFNETGNAAPAGEIAALSGGVLNQGAVSPVQDGSAGDGQSDLVFTEGWPGSTFGLTVRDPDGRLFQYGQNDRPTVAITAAAARSGKWSYTVHDIVSKPGEPWWVFVTRVKPPTAPKTLYLPPLDKDGKVIPCVHTVRGGETDTWSVRFTNSGAVPSLAISSPGLPGYVTGKDNKDGTFTVTATPPATLAASTEIPLTITASGAGTTAKVDCVERLAARADSSIPGRVVTPGGVGVGGATLVLTDPSGGTTTTASDGSGAFSFGGLVFGNYTISVTAPAGYSPRGAASADRSVDGTNAGDPVTFTVVRALGVATDSLPGGDYNTAYSANLTAAGGDTPYTWSLAGGSLPPGLRLGTDGLISGSPTAVGTYPFSVSVADGSGSHAARDLSIRVIGHQSQVKGRALVAGSPSGGFTATLGGGPAASRTATAARASNASVPAPMITAPDGTFTFTGITTGTYTVTIDLPSDIGGPATTTVSVDGLETKDLGDLAFSYTNPVCPAPAPTVASASAPADTVLNSFTSADNPSAVAQWAISNNGTAGWRVVNDPQVIALSNRLSHSLGSGDNGCLPAPPEGHKAFWFGEEATGSYVGSDAVLTTRLGQAVAAGTIASLPVVSTRTALKSGTRLLVGGTPANLAADAAAGSTALSISPIALPALPPGTLVETAGAYQQAADGGTSIAPQSGFLTSPTYDLTGLDHASLSYQTWFDVEAQRATSADQMLVLVCDLGNTPGCADGDFAPLASQNPLVDTGCPTCASTDFTSAGNRSTKPGWYRGVAFLDAYGGRSIKVRFAFSTGDTMRNGFRGWMVDDMAIVTTAPGQSMHTTIAQPLSTTLLYPINSGASTSSAYVNPVLQAVPAGANVVIDGQILTLQGSLQVGDTYLTFVPNLTPSHDLPVGTPVSGAAVAYTKDTSYSSLAITPAAVDLPYGTTLFLGTGPAAQQVRYNYNSNNYGCRYGGATAGPAATAAAAHPVPAPAPVRSGASTKTHASAPKPHVSGSPGYGCIVTSLVWTDTFTAAADYPPGTPISSIFIPQPASAGMTLSSPVTAGQATYYIFVDPLTFTVPAGTKLTIGGTDVVYSGFDLLVGNSYTELAASFTPSASWPAGTPITFSPDRLQAAGPVAYLDLGLASASSRVSVLAPPAGVAGVTSLTVTPLQAPALAGGHLLIEWDNRVDSAARGKATSPQTSTSASYGWVATRIAADAPIGATRITTDAFDAPAGLRSNAEVLNWSCPDWAAHYAIELATSGGPGSMDPWAGCTLLFSVTGRDGFGSAVPYNGRLLVDDALIGGDPVVDHPSTILSGGTAAGSQAAAVDATSGTAHVGVIPVTRGDRVLTFRDAFYGSNIGPLWGSLGYEVEAGPPATVRWWDIGPSVPAGAEYSVSVEALDSYGNHTDDAGEPGGAGFKISAPGDVGATVDSGNFRLTSSTTLAAGQSITQIPVLGAIPGDIISGVQVRIYHLGNGAWEYSTTNVTAYGTAALNIASFAPQYDITPSDYVYVAGFNIALPAVVGTFGTRNDDTDNASWTVYFSQLGSQTLSGQFVDGAGAPFGGLNTATNQVWVSPAYLNVYPQASGATAGTPITFNVTAYNQSDGTVCYPAGSAPVFRAWDLFTPATGNARVTELASVPLSIYPFCDGSTGTLALTLNDPGTHQVLVCDKFGPDCTYDTNASGWTGTFTVAAGAASSPAGPCPSRPSITPGPVDTVIATWDVGGVPSGAAVDSTLGLVYVVDHANSRVSALNISTGAVWATTTFTDKVSTVAVYQAGHKVLVGGDRGVTVMDGCTLAPIHTVVPIDSSAAVTSLVVAPDRNAAFGSTDYTDVFRFDVTTFGSGSGIQFAGDYYAGTVTDPSQSWTLNQWAQQTVYAGTNSATIVSNDATTLVVSGWSNSQPPADGTPFYIDAPLAFATTVPGNVNRNLAYDAITKHLYLSSNAQNAGSTEKDSTLWILDPDSGKVIGSVARAGDGPIAVNPSNQDVYVTDSISGNVNLIDPSTLAITARFDSGGHGAGAAILGALTGGDRIYVATTNPNRVNAYRPSDRSILASIDLGHQPASMSYDARSSRLFITTSDGKVLVVQAPAVVLTSNQPAAAVPAPAKPVPPSTAPAVASAPRQQPTAPAPPAASPSPSSTPPAP